ncbi:MAG: hypothetical protein KAI16_00710 [Candidatus Pacebacteria bacterium]|nr:hypothetical protein [Candidatus Paceibacterota bacterium]
MLILVHGNDIEKKKEKIKSVLDTLKKQRPNALFLHLDFLDLSIARLNELINTSGGLFEEKNIILFSNIFHDKDLKKYFLKQLTEIELSNNAFILSEDDIEQKDLTKITKHTTKNFSFKKILQNQDFNIFVLSDNLQQKDKKNLWLNYHRALNSGLAGEQIFANFFFALKSLALTEKFTEKESGMKSYPYKKAKQNLKNWDKKNLEKKMINLISYYNFARLDGLVLKDALEKFILEL